MTFKVQPNRSEFLDTAKCVYCGEELDIEHDPFFSEEGESADFYCRLCNKETNVLIQGVSYEYSVVPSDPEDMKKWQHEKKRLVEEFKKGVPSL